MLRRISNSMIFAVSTMCLATLHAQEEAIETVSGIALPRTVIASESITVRNHSPKDFMGYSTSKLKAEKGDIVVVSLSTIATPSVARLKGSYKGKEPPPPPPPKILVKTKNSAGCLVETPTPWPPDRHKKAFIATENAPIIYSSTAGANAMLSIEIRRDIGKEISDPQPDKDSSVKEELSELEKKQAVLKAAKEAGVLTEEEYQKKNAELISNNTMEEKLKVLDKAKEAGILSEDEYKKKKAELIKR